MDSGSNKASYPRGHTERLLKAISRLLADSLDDGLQATCHIHISDGAGRELAWRRVQVSRNNAGKIVECEIQAASGQAPATGKIAMGDDAVKHELGNDGRCTKCGVDVAEWLYLNRTADYYQRAPLPECKHRDAWDFSGYHPRNKPVYGGCGGM